MRLGYSNLEPTFITLVLADRCTRIPDGILSDVLVMIGKSMIPTDFVVLSYEKEPKDPLILGRSFLHIAGAIIDVRQGRIGLNVGDLYYAVRYEHFGQETDHIKEFFLDRFFHFISFR